jgi:IS66 C-terminal element
MEGTRARRAVPSRATERRAWEGAVDPRGRSAGHGRWLQLRFLKRQLSLPVSRMSQWCVRRSSSAVVIFASAKTLGHSAKARLEVLHHREARHSHAVSSRAGAVIGELGEQQFAEDALKGMLGAHAGRDHLVVGGAHAGQLQLARQLHDLMPLHGTLPRRAADDAAGHSGRNRPPARSPAQSRPGRHRGRRRRALGGHPSLIETCKLLAVEPHGYLADVITRIVNGHPQNRLDELTPWAFPATRQLPAAA